MEKVNSALIICPNQSCRILLHSEIEDRDIKIVCPECKNIFDYSPSLVPESASSDSFSYSRINLFQKCPKAYKLKYIDEKEEEFSTIEQYLGSWSIPLFLHFELI